MWSGALVPSNGYATSCGEQSESTPVPTTGADLLPATEIEALSNTE